MIKPDAVTKVGSIIQMVYDAGLIVTKAKMTKLTGWGEKPHFLLLIVNLFLLIHSAWGISGHIKSCCFFLMQGKVVGITQLLIFMCQLGIQQCSQLVICSIV